MPRFRRTIFFACGLAALGLYLACLSSTVTYTGDCGELISASWRGGVAHPSGYPLYCVLARLWAFLPVSEVAWRYNLFSALCGAATVTLVATLLARLTVSADASPTPSFSHFWPSIGGALLLAGLTFFGTQCVIAEVYALNGLLIAAIFGCALAWRQERKLHWLALLALLLGLSFNSHLSIVFVWPGVLLFLWPRPFPRPLFPGLSRLAAILLCCGLGFSFTLYLPLAARAFPEPATERIGSEVLAWYQPLNWGHPVDFARWKKHVTVGQYRNLLWKPLDVEVGGRVLHLKQFTQTPAQVARKFMDWCALLALQFLWCTPLLLVGAVAAFRPEASTGPTLRGRRLGGMLLLTFLLNTGLAMHYDVDSVFDIFNFLFPTYIVLAIWMGLGLGTVFRAARNSPRALMFCQILLVAVIFSQWFLFAQTASFRDNTSARDAALERALAAESLYQSTQRAPQLLLSSDDTLFPFWYVQKVLGRAPQAQTPWGQPLHAYEKSGRLLELVARLQLNGPVALASWDEKVDRGFPYQPLNATGSLWLASKRALPPPATPYKDLGKPLWAGFVSPRIRRLETAGFAVAFVCPSFARQKPLAMDIPNHARQIGLIDVTIARHGILRAPVAKSSPQPGVWRDSRRLIVPQKAYPGQALRILIPLQLPIDFQPGDYDVWFRLVRSSSDVTTPWTSGQATRIVVK